MSRETSATFGRAAQKADRVEWSATQKATQYESAMAKIQELESKLKEYESMTAEFAECKQSLISCLEQNMDADTLL